MHERPFHPDHIQRRQLLEEHADRWLALAIDNMLLEYPHNPWIIATGPESYRLHRDAHPVFFGSFDWHSCVEMYWVAIRLMRLFPGLSHESRARSVIDSLMTPHKVACEAGFFDIPLHRGFERPYGWGWLLTLWHEMEIADDPDSARWHETLAPLAETIMDLLADWLPKMTYPQRIGMHTNTAFGLDRSWDAVQRHRPELLEVMRQRSLDWFHDDRDYPARFEPSGADFLSPALCEAVLMSRVLGTEAFPGWLAHFLPGIERGEPGQLFTPAIVTDETDGQIAHLHGLNLSRAWAFRTIAEVLPDGDPRTEPLRTAMGTHVAASLGQVEGSDYSVEHWLAAYAVLLLSE
jgi:hypothetical protein